jgi:hypothetical protein
LARYVQLQTPMPATPEAAEVMRIDPKFSAEFFVRRLPYKDQKVIDDWVSALRKAGLK